MRSIRYFLLIILLHGIPSCAGAEESALQFRSGKIGFWIATDQNTVFDEQTLSLISQHAGIVVLNASLIGDTPAYHYHTVVKRLRELQPKLPVLSYTWASRWHDSKRVGTATLNGYPDLEFLLRNNKGKIIAPRQGKTLFGDVRKKEYRRWFVNKIKNMIKKTGADGVALDVVVRTPSKMLPSLCKQESNFCKSYAEGIDTLLDELHKEITPKVLLFNGLWSLHEGMLEDQQRLLNFTDGAAIEYFGFHPRKGLLPFKEGILSYLNIIKENPDKSFLLFGRGPNSYQDYREDYLWQRYLYCSYLLASGPNILFKYHASFQIPAHAGRSGGLDIYRDWLVDLGSAIAPYEKKEGLYLRRFTKGIVLVVPHDGRQVKYLLSDPMFSPEGKKFEGTITIEPGHGMILLRRKPPAITYSKKDFESPGTFVDGWISENIKSGEKGNQFLHLERISPEGEDWKHDLLLDPIRAPQPMPVLAFHLRTEDKEAKILLIAEVDDSKKQHDRVVVSMGGATSTKSDSSIAKKISFRMSNRGGKVPYIPLKISLMPDGQWHTILLNGRVVEASGRYIFRRWVFVRPVGSIDFDKILLKKSL